MGQATRILEEVNRRDAGNTEELLPLVYSELRRLAARKLAREKPGQTLQPTALVHEAYMRLAKSTNQDWESRGHFFAAAAEAMRRILVENARRKQRTKRGGERRRVDLTDADLVGAEKAAELLAVDEALELLTKEDATAAELVKLRYFAGMTGAEASAVLGISERSASRLWAFARAWLRNAVPEND